MVATNLRGLSPVGQSSNREALVSRVMWAPGSHARPHNGVMVLFAAGSRLISRSDLPARQATRLDAIAFSANVIELTYRRLEAFLWEADPNVAGFEEQSLSDAWSIIDWVHRLDGIVRNCPGLSKAGAGVVDLRNATSLVENHRNAIQHPASTLNAVMPSGRSPWGYLCWSRRADPAQPVPFSQVTRVGHLGRGVTPIVVNMTGPPRWPIDYVSLYSADSQAEIGITGQFEALARFGRGLEAAVASSNAVNAKGVLQIAEWSAADY
jgi:hypothetical protein